MLNELIYQKFSADVRELESQVLDVSRPFQIVVDNINGLFIPFPPPPFNQVTLFDSTQRYETNFGLHPVFSIQMPLLNYWYGAFLEEIQNNPIQLGKIRFESLGAWKGQILVPDINQFGTFVEYNNNNVGDAVQSGMDVSAFVNQYLSNTIDWYGTMTLDGLTSMLFNFPARLAALRITCYMKKSASSKLMLRHQKMFEQYKPVPQNILPELVAF